MSVSEIERIQDIIANMRAQGYSDADLQHQYRRLDRAYDYSQSGGAQGFNGLEGILGGLAGEVLGSIFAGVGQHGGRQRPPYQQPSQESPEQNTKPETHTVGDVGKDLRAAIIGLNDGNGTNDAGYMRQLQSVGNTVGVKFFAGENIADGSVLAAAQSKSLLSVFNQTATDGAITKADMQALADAVKGGVVAPRAATVAGKPAKPDTPEAGSTETETSDEVQAFAKLVADLNDGKTVNDREVLTQIKDIMSSADIKLFDGELKKGAYLAGDESRSLKDAFGAAVKDGDVSPEDLQRFADIMRDGIVGVESSDEVQAKATTGTPTKPVERDV